LYNEAQVQIKLKEYQDALNAFNKLDRMKPGNISILLGKGDALRGLGLFEESVACYDNISKIDPQNRYASEGKAEALVGWADALYELQKFGEGSTRTTPSR
jgi:tetratricopeptide (TPR) repeat protein